MGGVVMYFLGSGIQIENGWCEGHLLAQKWGNFFRKKKTS